MIINSEIMMYATYDFSQLHEIVDIIFPIPKNWHFQNKKRLKNPCNYIASLLKMDRKVNRRMSLWEIDRHEEQLYVPVILF